MNETEQALERARKRFGQARDVFTDYANKAPVKPLDDPEWQTWIREFIRLSKNYTNAYIGLQRQWALVKLESEESK